MNTDQLIPLLVSYGTKVVGAIALWVIGGAIINFAVSRVEATASKANLDATTSSYLLGALRVIGRLALIIGMLGFFGVETTSFAAVLAAAGVAIGMAWSGLLANFAAGVFLAVLRPFKVGDMITGGGVTGVVKELGMFATTLTTADNLQVVVGNNKVFGDTITNFSANPTRRVDLTAQLSGATDVDQAIARIQAAVAAIPNVAASPAPEVTILEYNPMGPVLAVRPHCNNNHYWQVFFDTNRALRTALAEFPGPQPHYAITMHPTPGAKG
jgi:small conductance mechanosensitive channel